MPSENSGLLALAELKDLEARRIDSIQNEKRQLEEAEQERIAAERRAQREQENRPSLRARTPGPTTSPSD